MVLWTHTKQEEAACLSWDMERDGDTGVQRDLGGKVSSDRGHSLSHVASSLSRLAGQGLGVDRGELQVWKSIM